ncbi:DsbA family oxidoreductase [Dokdonella sp. MW10]|uniref:DsbA family oxidoreductase n=1 Tax=Dokdonella sp. MW10 TaxID=2992926 RepID=UPI003F81AC58
MSTAAVPLRIDIVSDVACPWCAVGLASLERAIAKLGGDVAIDLHFQPFELNPQMAREGEAIGEHLARKYGMTAEQLEQSQAALRARGAEVGVVFGERERIRNTFDAHRLLHWAGTLGSDRQLVLKRALLQAYFTDGADVSDPEVLVRVAAASGLDADEARAILAGDRHADDVRREERRWLDLGIRSVPAVVIEQRHLVSGGQPVEVFEQALRQIAGAKREAQA